MDQHGACTATSVKRPTVEVDGEFLLNRLESIERSCADIRKAVAQGVFQPASPAGININVIDWRTKENEPAREGDPWSWAHAYHLNGPIKDEARQLVEEIERTGKVVIGEYELTLSGRDKMLLSRTKIGTRRR